MANIEPLLGNLIEKLRQNLGRIVGAEEVPLPQAKPPKSPGVYMLF